jgi:hypothetical protein
VDEQLILDTAEAATPALRALAGEILEGEARHRGVSLDAADVLLRRAVGAPAEHITAAANQLLEQLAAAEEIILPEQGIVAVLARAAAQLLMSGIELDWSAAEAQRSWSSAACSSAGPTLFEPPIRWDQAMCAQVLRLTAAWADTSLMPNSSASCRYVRPSARRALSARTFPAVSLARGLPSPTAPS